MEDSGFAAEERRGRIVELLNSAALGTDSGSKVDELRQVQELLLHSSSEAKETALLLDTFLEELLAFQKDRNVDIRKWVVGFIEAVCQKDPDLLPKVIANLQLMMSDGSVAVHKRVIQAMTHLYRVALGWLVKAKSVDASMEAVWSVVCSIKEVINGLLEADNDGIRTHTVKFMEMLVIAQTCRSSESIATKPHDFALDDVPLTLAIIRRRRLEEEAEQVFEMLVKYHQSATITSANLMTCMGALANIARCRPPQFMSKVITALEMLQANLPPTLSRSQVSSVRKHLKNQLLNLLKHPLAVKMHFNNVTTLLTDLGASRDEVMKVMPRFDEVRKRVKRQQQEQEQDAKMHSSKRSKLELEDEEEDEEEEEEEEKQPKEAPMESAVDITEVFIRERLLPSVATELVLQSMAALPREIPPQFHNTYTPIAAAGTEGQVKHVARLLATQLTSCNLGPGIESVRRRKQEAAHLDREEQRGVQSTEKISTLIGGSTSSVSKSAKMAGKIELQPTGLSSKRSGRSKAVRLADLTKPMRREDRREMLSSALRRIIRSERSAHAGGAKEGMVKILTSLAPQLQPEYKSQILRYILEDLPRKCDQAFSLLFEEFCFYQGFNRNAVVLNRRSDDNEYNIVLCRLIKGAIEKYEGKERERLLRRFYLEAPIITDDAIQMLKQFIVIEGAAITVVHLLKDLVMRRPTKKLNCLNFLLEFCSHEATQVRQTANDTVIQLHANGDFNEIIEDYSTMYLRFLQQPEPPSMLFGEDRGRLEPVAHWSEDIVRVCLHLFLSLLPKKLSLLDSLAKVYVDAPPDVKRILLRIVDCEATTQIDMTDPELLKFIEVCPKGSETLVIRLVHILTDNKMPTPDLVEQIRKLYDLRISDVRFLIPVLAGLTKSEVLQVLPKLLSLSPVVVKEVLHRLYSSGPLSPSDLLIALHNIDASQCEMKLVMKAVSLCFAEKTVYTQEVLIIVLQQLLELQTIPLLFMRTVIQSVNLYPGMVGFVMNVLQKLIIKQVWKQPKTWDGFVRCCERCVPQSYAVLLQLPPARLEELLKSSPKLRDPLLDHVQTFTDEQRAHVPKQVIEVIYNLDHQIRHGGGGEVKEETRTSPMKED